MSLLAIIGVQLRVFSSRVSVCSVGFSTLNVWLEVSCIGMLPQSPEWTSTSRIGEFGFSFCSRPIIGRLVASVSTSAMDSISDSLGFRKSKQIVEMLRFVIFLVDTICNVYAVSPLKNLEHSAACERMYISIIL